MKTTSFILVLLLMSALSWADGPQQKEKMPAKDSASLYAMAKPVKPYRIIGNVYYVGASDLTSYLIATPQGHILIDAGLEQMAPQIEANIEALGFHVRDVKILLNTQAHVDHAAGFAELKRATGAKLMVSSEDTRVIETGGAADFLWPERFRWEAAKVDRLINDGDLVELGGVTLTAHLTPGHTKGCTTWTMTVKEGDKDYHMLFLGSTTRVGAKLVENATYPQIASDYERTFRILRTLPCDVFLASHASFYGGLEKAERLARGEQPNPFVDSAGYKKFLDEQETTFHAELKKAKAEANGH